MLVEAMPSVKKASAEVSPWVLREVDRLNENPEKPVANAGSEDPNGHNGASVSPQRRSERMKAQHCLML